LNYNKIKQVRFILNLNQTELAKLSNLKQADISKLEKGERTFMPNSFIQFLNKSGFDLNSFFDDAIDLVFKNQNTINDSPLNKDMTAHLTVHSKNNDSPLNKNKKSTSEEKDIKGPSSWTAPKIITVNSEGSEAAIMIDIKAAAGLPFNIDNPQYYSHLPTMMLPKNQFISGTYICIQTKGDSMQPTILHQDWLISRFEDNPVKNIKDNHIYVVVSKDGIIVKRVVNQLKAKGLLVCQSDNLIGNPPFIIEANEILQVYKAEAKLSFNLDNLNATLSQRLTNIEYELLELRKTIEK
jgi:phage repressor protein C with HTH and peptisase S24 domain